MKICYKCSSKINEDYKFCPHCGANQTEIKCPNCSYSNEPNSKFCQDCGSKLTGDQEKEQKKTINQPEGGLITQPVPDYGITIEFNHSTSQSFEFAVEEAKKFESFVELGEGKKSIYRVTVTENQIQQLNDLVENMKGWRNRRVFHNGEKVPWDSIFSYKWCLDQRKASYKPELYCFGYENNYDFNLWGCLQAGLSFNDNSELFTYGQWLNTKGDWQFDKKKSAMKLKRVFFSIDFVLQ